MSTQPLCKKSVSDLFNKRFFADNATRKQHPPPSRNDSIKMYIEWAKAHPEYEKESAVESRAPE